MPALIGPYDGRKARRKRCNACVKRQIKCDGGVPCVYCVRTGQACILRTMPIQPNVVFVCPKPNEEVKITTVSAVRRTPPNSLPKQMPARRTDCYLPYFFTRFLPSNTFTSEKLAINNDLLVMVQESAGLRDAIDAVAALHARKQKYLACSDEAHSVNPEALQAYMRSVRSVQDKISAGSFMHERSALWTTFLLGLFELMHDSTGTNWLAHFLHGTSTLLRIQRPEALTFQDAHSIQRRSFFLATRIFEISRSLIFSSPTFLSLPEWTTALADFWANEGAALWHPKEALLDILPLIADLSIRGAKFCKQVSQFSSEEQSSQIQALGFEGFRMRASLQHWFIVASTWENEFESRFAAHSESRVPDKELLLGYIYYHAISILLSGTYDYHPHWTPESAPILPRSTIEWHVCEILDASYKLLDQGVAGVLLFFPLRVAGARAMDNQSRTTILDLLRATSNRGYVVAEAFTTDLSELWSCNSSEAEV
ncbi:hypothetical protein T440DRAFT_421311 [Plenodomus tracheiphilus IPT5]|uniref:Zn(2)-C6 fungal-type domain-containing protein n=1 Tax=Plenodomus tracheiphilus IPT5 TaxID=1408161 RepID=A0A6A7BDX4_9PLEO|nr:hypothetical protein T440DRAFT_421311 [Plenodomus tracheiphilus IPT5]